MSSYFLFLGEPNLKHTHIQHDFTENTAGHTPRLYRGKFHFFGNRPYLCEIALLHGSFAAKISCQKILCVDDDLFVNISNQMLLNPDDNSADDDDG